VTTNEADRTDDRDPTSDVLAPGEEPSDESLPPDPEADEFEVDEPVHDRDVHDRRADEIEEHSGSQASPDQDPLPGEPEMEPAQGLVDDAAVGEAPDTGARTADAGRGDFAPRGDEPFVAAEATHYQDRWYEIQTGFVDEPGHAVQSAGELLTELIDDLNRRLTTELESLDARRSGSDDVSTEDLRVTFQRYRSFFDRLMTV
jgi:hypothetical protein